MKNFFCILTSCCITGLFAQGPIITPLKSNIQLKTLGNQQAIKRSLPDTLQLPYLDDFTTSTLYPDQRFWLDSQVYVNDHFAVSPPTYGVATFDNLDKKGRPYQAINGNTSNHSDSLTSNYINLRDYKNGVNTVNYVLADSIYLSFLYQTQGLGDPLDKTDSLVLKFKSVGGFWTTIWKTTGSSLKPFKQVMVAIKNSDYLIPDFQFRFINYGKTTGNMNQWHIDYVRMKSNRNWRDTTIADVAINGVPVGPLQIYESMPYDHFKAAPATHSSAFHTLKIRNNDSNAVNVQYKCEVRNTYDQLKLTYPLGFSSRNIKGLSDSSENYNAFTFDTLSGKQPSLKLKYTIAPLANDFTSDDYNNKGNNNEYTKTVLFKNYFAYDDGSAEGGFGLDYGSLPAGPGYAAVKFKASKKDTLRGVSIFFNRSVADVTYKSFTLIVWKNISEPPAPNTSSDIILKRIEMPTAIYTDSINGFADIIFDTSIAINAGDFYIGWQQNTNFILNIGYDNNYKYNKTGGRNPNLFYNLNGYWEKVNGNISGAVMIRPLVGDRIIVKNSASISNIVSKSNIEIYPNPGTDLIQFHSDIKLISVKVFDLSGKVLMELSGENIEQIVVDHLSSGFYMVEIVNENMERSIQKWIKQ